MTCPRLMLPLVLVLAIVAASCGGGEATCDRIAGVRAGVCVTAAEDRAPAPDDAAPVLGADGELSLADLRGDVVVLNFWASWCGPCRSEQPELNLAAEELAPLGVRFVGVNLQDSEVNAEAHEDEFAMPYPSLFDPASAYAANFRGVGPSTIPSTIFVDRDGRVALRLIGETRATEVITLARLLASE